MGESDLELEIVVVVMKGRSPPQPRVAPENLSFRLTPASSRHDPE